MIDITKFSSKAPNYSLEQLFDAGCHFGHQKRKWHPKMAPFIYTQKNGVHIFDLQKTANQLKLAYDYIYELASQGKTLIIVGTKKSARDTVKRLATEAAIMYVNSRWLGGFLTNWQQIVRSIKRMIDLEDGLKTDKFKGYTKFERGQIEKELSRLQRFFGGLRELKAKPDCIFVVDPNREKNAVKEANGMGIPVVALIDSNSDPSLVDLPIPANDDAVKSVALIVEEITKAYQAGKQKIAK